MSDLNIENSRFGWQHLEAGKLSLLENIKGKPRKIEQERNETPSVNP